MLTAHLVDQEFLLLTQLKYAHFSRPFLSLCEGAGDQTRVHNHVIYIMGNLQDKVDG